MRTWHKWAAVVAAAAMLAGTAAAVAIANRDEPTSGDMAFPVKCQLKEPNDETRPVEVLGVDDGQLVARDVDQSSTVWLVYAPPQLFDCPDGRPDTSLSSTVPTTATSAVRR